MLCNTNGTVWYHRRDLSCTSTNWRCTMLPLASPFFSCRRFWGECCELRGSFDGWEVGCWCLIPRSCTASRTDTVRVVQDGILILHGFSLSPRDHTISVLETSNKGSRIARRDAYGCGWMLVGWVGVGLLFLSKYEHLVVLDKRNESNEMSSEKMRIHQLCCFVKDSVVIHLRLEMFSDLPL